MLGTARPWAGLNTIFSDGKHADGTSRGKGGGSSPDREPLRLDRRGADHSEAGLRRTAQRIVHTGILEGRDRESRFFSAWRKIYSPLPCPGVESCAQADPGGDSSPRVQGMDPR